MKEKAIKTTSRIAVGFETAAEMVELSKTFLRNAANDPDPERRLKTVRVNRRRLIRAEDLADWFARVSREDSQAA